MSTSGVLLTIFDTFDHFYGEDVIEARMHKISPNNICVLTDGSIELIF